MAEPSAELLDFTPLRSSDDLLDFLQEKNFLANFDDFRNKFFGKLIAYLEDPEYSSPYIVFGEETLVAAEIFSYLPDLLKDEAFLQALGIEAFESPLLQQARQEFTIQSLLGTKEASADSPIEVLRINRNHAFQAAEKLRRLYRQLLALSGQTGDEKEPEYEEALQNALQTISAELTQNKNQILEFLEYNEPLQLDKEVQQRLAARWKNLEEESVKEEKQEIDALRTEHRKALEKQLEEWKKAVLSLQEQNSKEEINLAQLEQDLQGLLGQKGLLELFFLWANNGSLSDLLENIAHYCTYRIEPFNPRRASTPAQQAELDLELTLQKLLAAVKKLRDFLQGVREKTVDIQEKKFSEAVSTTILKETAVSTTSADGGGADGNQDPDLPLRPGIAGGLAAKWSLVAEAWRSAWYQIQSLEADNSTKQALFALLSENNLRPENLLSLNFDFESFFATLSTEAQVRSAEQADRLLELLSQVFPESKTVPPAKTIDTASPQQPLYTAFSAEAELSPQSEKLRSIGQISRAKAELVQFTLQQIRAKLASQGYSDAEIAAYLELYEGQISSQIWIAILDKNGLNEKLSLQDLVAIEKAISDQYSALISIAYPPQNPRGRRLATASSDEEMLRRFLAQNGLDPDLYLQQFSRESIQKALNATQELSKLSFAERIGLVSDLLKDKMDQGTATSLAQVFIALASGGNIGSHAFLFDDLAQQIYQRPWKELSKAEQARISGLLSYFYENVEIFGLVVGLSDLRDLKTKVRELQILFEKMTSFQSTPLSRTVLSFGEVQTDEPSKRGWNDAVLDGEAQTGAKTKNVTLQVSVIFAMEIQPEIRENLLTLVMQRPISMQEFGGLLEFAQTGQQPAEPVDGRLLAQFQNLGQLQQENPEAFAAQQQAAFQQFAQADYNRKRLEVAIKLIRAAAQAYAGNPAALIALLSDKEAREIIQKEVQKWGLRIGATAAGGAAYTIFSPLISLVSGISSVLSGLGLLSQGAGSAAGALGSTGSVLASEAIKDAAATTAAGAGKELTALNKTLADLGNTLSQIPTNVSTAASTLGIGKSLAVVAFSSIFGPILLAGVLTIITITVIGSSLNDLPLGGSFIVGNSGNKILNTTDMACIELDAGSFEGAGFSQDVPRIQTAIIQAMRSSYARSLCEVIPSGTRIVVAYNSSWIMAGHRRTGFGHEIGFSGNYLSDSRNWPDTSLQYTLYHEMGHIFTKYTNVKQAHNQAMGGRVVRSYPFYNTGVDNQEESTAEGLAWFLFLPVTPNVYAGNLDVNLPLEYPALTAAYENIFATLGTQ